MKSKEELDRMTPSERAEHYRNIDISPTFSISMNDINISPRVAVIVILAALGIGAAAIVHVYNNPRSGFSPGSRSSGGGGGGRRAANGSVSTLKVSDGGNVFVADSEAVLDRLVQFSVANDQAGIDSLIVSGAVWSVPSGSKCLVIDRGFVTTEIRITEGSRSGQSGFVPREFVAK